MLSRRSLLAAAAGAFLSPNVLGEESHEEECIKENPSQKAKDISEVWRDNRYVPPGLTNGEMFWGYPVWSRIDRKLIPPRMGATALSLFSAAINDKFLAVTSAYQKPYCDNKDKVYQSFRTKASGPEYDETALDLMKGFGHLPLEYQKMPEEERFFSILATLSNIFRAPKYKLHTDWLGVPKTAIKLAQDQEGDCKDFTLARYMAARFMGVKPEHAMMVLYVDGNREGLVGHANMAIYNQKYGWVVVDGTGRASDRQSRGETIIYQNDQRAKDQLVESYIGQAVPIAYITAKGIGQFDSIWERSEHTGFPRFKPVQKIQQRSKGFIAEIVPEERQRPPDFDPPGIDGP